MEICSVPNAQSVVRMLEVLACEALVQDCGLQRHDAAERLRQELQYYRDLELGAHDLKAVFRRFCVSLANRGGLFNLVFGGGSSFAKVERSFARVLLGFDPRRVMKKYKGNVDQLLANLLKARGLTEIQANRQISQGRAGFPLYARGLLAGAEYFARFEDGAAFAAFVAKWRTDPDITYMLPQYFGAQGIPGFGAALAADFLKELGVKELGKPDRWVIRIMQEAGWIDETASKFAVQRAFWAVWQQLGDDYPPVIIDKLMFVVATGRFEMVPPVLFCNSRFDELCRRLSSPPRRCTA